MDRAVRFEPESTSRLDPQMRNPVLVFGEDIILELKFTARFPDWFREMVRVFGLQHAPAAKYVDGITRLGELRVRAAIRDGTAPQHQAAALTDETTARPPSALAAR